MTPLPHFLRRAAATSLAVGIIAGPAGAAAEKSLIPMPYNAGSDTELQITVNQRQPRIGDTVEICFSASKPGYVTLWNIGTSGKVARVFPNAFSGGNTGTMKVEGGKRYCAGETGDPFRFRVNGPEGLDELYIVWSAAAEHQPAAASFPTAAELAAAFEQMRQQASDAWATLKTTYDIVGPNGPQAPQLPPSQNHGAQPPAAVAATPQAPQPPQAPSASATPAPTTSAPAAPAPAAPAPAAPAPAAGQQVYILAMGSNVGDLTKSNQDAHMFVDDFRRLFSVPDSNVRVYDNVYRQQFADGMAWLKTAAKPSDFVIIYYSGHGAQIPDDDGDEADGLDEAFVPYDLQFRKDINLLVRDDEFASWVGALQTNAVLTVIDACHSGGLSRGFGDVLSGAKPKFFIADFGPQPAPATRNAAIPKRMPKGTTLAAAREDQSALEGQQGSFFTLALLESLRSTNSGTMLDVFTNAAQLVEKKTSAKQTPILSGEASIAQRITIRP